MEPMTVMATCTSLESVDKVYKGGKVAAYMVDCALEGPRFFGTLTLPSPSLPQIGDEFEVSVSPRRGGAE